MRRHVRTRRKRKYEIKEGLRVLTLLCHLTTGFAVMHNSILAWLAFPSDRSASSGPGSQPTGHQRIGLSEA
jgi:hypothetical protein